MARAIPKRFQGLGKVDCFSVFRVGEEESEDCESRVTEASSPSLEVSNW
jgi:hypothetical protein